MLKKLDKNTITQITSNISIPSITDIIKELLDNAFGLLKSYSEGKFETQAKVVSKVKVIKEKNCCEECCENICG